MTDIVLSHDLAIIMFNKFLSVVHMSSINLDGLEM